LSSIITREEVIGKLVINEKGYEVGKVVDIAISIEGTGILKVETEDGNVVEIPMTMIQAIGKYILLRPKKETTTPTFPPPPPPTTGVSQQYPPPPVQQQPLPPSPPPEQQGIVCPRCGHVNPPGARFCQNCGTPLPQQEGGLSSLRKKLGI